MKIIDRAVTLKSMTGDTITLSSSPDRFDLVGAGDIVVISFDLAGAKILATEIERLAQRSEADKAEGNA